MSYATGDDLIARYDVDLIGDLATDDRETLGRGQVPKHKAVLAALSEASGQINSSLIVGGAYTPDQLTALTGIDREYLAGLVCDLAMVRLFRRRPEAVPEGMMGELTERTSELIEMLRKGLNIFNLDDTVDATIVDHAGPTAVQLDRRNDLTTRMGRYFPAPVTRLPRSQGGDP